MPNFVLIASDKSAKKFNPASFPRMFKKEGIVKVFF